MRGLIKSINRNDIYINRARNGIKYNIGMIKEHMEVCQELLIAIDIYSSYCKSDDENEFIDTVNFIERYLETLQKILEKEYNKNNDLSSMWNYVLSKHNFL